MFAVSLLLLATTLPTSGVSHGYSDSQLISEFHEVCSDLTSLNRIRSIALANGWAEYTAPKDSTHAKFLANVKSLIAQDEMKIGNFTKLLSGTEIILAISDVKLSDGSSVTCRLHDYSASKNIDESKVSKIVGSDPKQAKNNINLTARAWFPGLKPQHTSLQTIYVPAESPLVNEVSLKGLILIARQKKGLN